ncbi:MAG: hypothetical protein KF762_11765 [Acidobacteria bacterium]|nr:hypothetical protein [Acidobacteriota bacterium]
MRRPARQQGLIIQCDIPNLEFGILETRDSKPSTTPSAAAAAGHPPRGLIREGDAAEIARAFAEIPLDKINEARDLLEGLKNSD